MAGKEGYWLMDGRANYDVDAAYVLLSCIDMEEAKAHINDYGADTCIVDVETQKVVDSLMWRNQIKSRHSRKIKKAKRNDVG